MAVFEKSPREIDPVGHSHSAGRWMMTTLSRASGRRFILTLLTFLISLLGAWIYTPARPLARWDEVHPNYVTGVNVEHLTTLAFSPDGQTVLTNNAVARLRETATGRVLAELGKPRDQVTPLPNTALNFPKFFDDGRLLVAQIGGTAYDTEGSIPSLKVWDVATGRERASFSNLGNQIFTPKFVLSADGKALAFPLDSPDQPRESYSKLRVWTPTLGLVPHEFPAVQQPSAPRPSGSSLSGLEQPFALSPDGRSLFGVDGFLTITQWDVATGRTVGTIDRYRGRWPYAMIFAPDGQLFVWFFRDCEFIDLENGRRRSLSLPSDRNLSILPIRFSADGKELLIGFFRQSNEYFQIFDFERDRFIDIPHYGFEGISANGHRMTTIIRKPDMNWPMIKENKNDTVVVVTDQPSNVEKARFLATGAYQTHLSQDGRIIALMESQNVRTLSFRLWSMVPFGWRLFNAPREFSDSNQITVLDVDTGRKLATIPTNLGGNIGLAFSPDQKRLVVEYPSMEPPREGSMRWEVEVWELSARRSWWPAVGLSTVTTLLAYVIGRGLDAYRRRMMARVAS